MCAISILWHLIKTLYTIGSIFKNTPDNAPVIRNQKGNFKIKCEWEIARIFWPLGKGSQFFSLTWFAFRCNDATEDRAKERAWNLRWITFRLLRYYSLRWTLVKVTKRRLVTICVYVVILNGLYSETCATNIIKKLIMKNIRWIIL